MKPLCIFVIVIVMVSEASHNSHSRKNVIGEVKKGEGGKKANWRVGLESGKAQTRHSYRSSLYTLDEHLLLPAKCICFSRALLSPQSAFKLMRIIV